MGLATGRKFQVIHLTCKGKNIIELTYLYGLDLVHCSNWKFPKLYSVRIFKSKNHIVRIWTSKNSHWNQPGWSLLSKWLLLTSPLIDISSWILGMWNKTEPVWFPETRAVLLFEINCVKILGSCSVCPKRKFRVFYYYLCVCEILFPVVCACNLQLEEITFANQVSFYNLLFALARWAMWLHSCQLYIWTPTEGETPSELPR